MKKVYFGYIYSEIDIQSTKEYITTIVSIASFLDVVESGPIVMGLCIRMRRRNKTLLYLTERQTDITLCSLKTEYRGFAVYGVLPRLCSVTMAKIPLMWVFGELLLVVDE